MMILELIIDSPIARVIMVKNLSKIIYQISAKQKQLEESSIKYSSILAP